MFLRQGHDENEWKDSYCYIYTVHCGKIEVVVCKRSFGVYEMKRMAWFCTIILYWPETTWANEMNFGMHHALGAGSGARPVELLSSALPVCYYLTCLNIKPFYMSIHLYQHLLLRTNNKSYSMSIAKVNNSVHRTHFTSQQHKTLRL